MLQEDLYHVRAENTKLKELEVENERRIKEMWAAHKQLERQKEDEYTDIVANYEKERSQLEL